MKIKNLCKITLPVMAMPIVACAVVACSQPKEATGADIIHKDGTTSHYDTFEEALKGVNSYETISLNQNTVLNKPIKLSVVTNVTIDGNGKKIWLPTMNGSTVGWRFDYCSFLTLKNIDINTGNTDSGIYFDGGSFTLDNVNIHGANPHVINIYNNATGTIKNSTITSTHVNNWMSGAVYLPDPDCRISVENSTVQSFELYFPLLTNRVTKRGVLNFEKGNHVNYIKVPSDYGLADFNNVVKGWEDIKDLWFGGYLRYENDLPYDYKALTDTDDSVETLWCASYEALSNWNQIHAVEQSYSKPLVVHLVRDINFKGSNWLTMNGQGIKLFDGHDHTISNMIVVDSAFHATGINTPGIGMFGRAAGTTVQNLTISRSTVNAKKYGKETEEYFNVGMIFGYATGANTNNPYNILRNVNVIHSTIRGDRKVGSLVGTVDSDYGSYSTLKVEHCGVYDVDIYDDWTEDVYVGGLVGWVNTVQTETMPRPYGLIEITSDEGESAIGAVRVHYKKGEMENNFIAKLYLKSHGPYVPVDEDPNVYVGSFEVVEEE